MILDRVYTSREVGIYYKTTKGKEKAGVMVKIFDYLVPVAPRT